MKARPSGLKPLSFFAPSLSEQKCIVCKVSANKRGLCFGKSKDDHAGIEKTTYEYCSERLFYHVRKRMAPKCYIFLFETMSVLERNTINWKKYSGAAALTSQSMKAYSFSIITHTILKHNYFSVFHTTLKLKKYSGANALW